MSAEDWPRTCPDQQRREGALSIKTSGLAPTWVFIPPSPVRFCINATWSQHWCYWQWTKKLWRGGRSFNQDCPNPGLKICCSHKNWVLYQAIPSEWCNHIASRLLNQECSNTAVHQKAQDTQPSPLLDFGRDRKQIFSLICLSYRMTIPYLLDTKLEYTSLHIIIYLLSVPLW